MPYLSRSPGTGSLDLAWKQRAARDPCQPDLVENTFPSLNLAGWNKPGEAGKASSRMPEKTPHLGLELLLRDAAPSRHVLLSVA